MAHQIFFDPDRKRWKRLRRILDVVAVVSTIILVLFFLGAVRNQHLPELLFPAPKLNYKALHAPRASRKVRLERAARRKARKRRLKASLNSGQLIRAAYYINGDAASFASLKKHIHQIDMLFPQWLYVTTADGTLEGANDSEFPVRIYPLVSPAGVRGVDPQNAVHNLIARVHENTAVFPMLSNYNAVTQDWDQSVGPMLRNPASRARLESQLIEFFKAHPEYRGVSLDLESIPDDAMAGYREFIGELAPMMHARHLRVYVNEGVGADTEDLQFAAAETDGILLMNYDQHESSSAPGPIAGERWFDSNLERVLSVIPKQKLICSIGNYGYDWAMSAPSPRHPSRVLSVNSLSVQDSWQEAADSDATVHFEGDELNPHFAYVDEDTNERHEVWMLDAVTALNEMRDAQQLGINTFALWRLGSEDPSVWSIWNHPESANAPDLLLKNIPPGDDVNTNGEGDILRITGQPHDGSRTVQMDTDNWTAIDEHMLVYPQPYTIRYYGYKPGEVALTFDDGPDPEWTPKILRILKEKHAHATFMMIGEEAEAHPGYIREVADAGNEIGSHTFTHPDIAEISTRQLDLQLNLTERLFASQLGVKPLFFRPPYSIDQQPDTNDQAASAYHIQKMGYIIVGNQIDTNDWDEHPRKTPAGITRNVLEQLQAMKTESQVRGSVILMHDGGGDRSVTVATVPVLIDALRAHGYKIVQLSDLIGLTRAQVMPRLTPKEVWQARVDWIAFLGFTFFVHIVVMVFFLGDILMSARLLLVGLLALIDRLRRRHTPIVPGGFTPPVAVVIPTFNEEKVIVRTLRSIFQSDYPRLRVIVSDDGSCDRTVEVARDAFPREFASGRLIVLEKPNGGKAEALNHALSKIDEDFYVGIDADTVIAPDAISLLVAHFSDPTVGAIAGNAKVGNRVNLWTQWQALEYITSQNFERRALDLFNVVTVVPGAIGAWRTEAVRRGGGYPLNTVAEDADLTMNLLEQGYKAIYEDRALAFTEAPANAAGLMRQRFRWSFGTLQSVYKHQAAFLRNKAMGLFALPNIVIFQILLPLVSPFIDLMFLFGAVQYLLDRHFHPETASAASFDKLLVYFLAFLVIDFITSALAFSLERPHAGSRRDTWLLFHILLQRFAYRQIFSVVLAKTIKRAIDGRPFSWDKLERTARISRQAEQAVAMK